MAIALVAGRAAFDLLQLGRRIAAELAGDAIDPAAPLTMADRYALATLALAVDVEASRRAGVEPVTAEVLPLLAADLARIEREAPTQTFPPPARAGGSTPRGHRHAPR